MIAIKNNYKFKIIEIKNSFSEENVPPHKIEEGK